VSHFVNQLDLQISDGTARLQEANVLCYCVARKIALMSKHRNNRIVFALYQLNTASPEDWDQTIWTEKIFCLEHNRRL